MLIRTVDCQNWKKSVDIYKHPAVKRAFSSNVEEVFVKDEINEQSDDRMKSFEDVYLNGVWFLNKESRSGAGSTIRNTERMIKILHNLVDEFKIHLQKDRIRLKII